MSRRVCTIRNGLVRVGTMPERTRSNKHECPHNPNGILCRSHGSSCERCGWSSVVDTARRARIPGLAAAHAYRQPGSIVGLHLKDGR